MIKAREGEAIHEGDESKGPANGSKPGMAARVLNHYSLIMLMAEFGSRIDTEGMEFGCQLSQTNGL